MRCINCNHENPQGNIFCENCGKKLTESKCDKCGATIQQGAAFCPKCEQSYAAVAGKVKAKIKETARTAGKKKDTDSYCCGAGCTRCGRRHFYRHILI